MPSPMGTEARNSLANLYCRPLNATLQRGGEKTWPTATAIKPIAEFLKDVLFAMLGTGRPRLIGGRMGAIEPG